MGGGCIEKQTVSLYSLGCSRTHSNSSASVSQVLGIQACTTMIGKSLLKTLFFTLTAPSRPEKAALAHMQQELRKRTFWDECSPHSSAWLTLAAAFIPLDVKCWDHRCAPPFQQQTFVLTWKLGSRCSFNPGRKSLLRQLDYHQKSVTSQAWWCTPLIPVLGRQRQADLVSLRSSWSTEWVIRQPGLLDRETLSWKTNQTTKPINMHIYQLVFESKE